MVGYAKVSSILSTMLAGIPSSSRDSHVISQDRVQREGESGLPFIGLVYT